LIASQFTTRLKNVSSGTRKTRIFAKVPLILGEKGITIVDCTSKENVEERLRGIFKVDDNAEVARVTLGTKIKPVSSEEHHCLVILAAHLLSESHRQFVAAHCFLASYKFVLVVPYYRCDDLLIITKEPNSSRDITFKVVFDLCHL